MNTQADGLHRPCRRRGLYRPGGQPLRHASFSPPTAPSASPPSYGGTSSGSLKLHYKLLPEAIAERIQNLFSEGNVVQRLVYCQDGLKLFQRSPLWAWAWAL